MATSTAQRAGIWIIAIALTGGTLFGFVAMILSSKNDSSKQAALQKYQTQLTEYQTKTTDQQTALTKRTNELSAKYATTLIGYRTSYVKTFDKNIKAVSIKTILPGSGATISNNTTYVAYYIGFTPDDNIFDSSIDGKKLKTPLIVRPAGVIAGWSEGLNGKKIGGAYELSIPSDKAYGAQGSGDKIKPNTPLKFIIMPIEKLETFNQPRVTQEVIDAYGSGQ